MLPERGAGFLRPMRPKHPQKPYTRKTASSTVDFDQMRAAVARRKRKAIKNLELVASGQMTMSRLRPKTSIDVATVADLQRLERMAEEVRR